MTAAGGCDTNLVWRKGEVPVWPGNRAVACVALECPDSGVCGGPFGGLWYLDLSVVRPGGYGNLSRKASASAQRILAFMMRTEFAC